MGQTIVENCWHFNFTIVQCEKPVLLLQLVHKCNIWQQMLGRIWVSITPRTIALHLRGFDLYQRRGILRISGEKWLFFSYFEEKYMKSLRATP